MGNYHRNSPQISNHGVSQKKSTRMMLLIAGALLLVFLVFSAFQLPDGPPMLIREFIGHSGMVFAVGLSPDGRTLFSGGQNGEAYFWNTATGERIKGLDGIRGSVYAVAFSPETDQFLAASTSGTIFLWESTNGGVVRELQSSQTASFFDAAFSLDGNRIVGGDYLGAASIQVAGQRVMLAS